MPPGLSFSPERLLEALGNREFEQGIELLCSVDKLPQSIIDNPSIAISIWQMFAGTRPLVSQRRAQFLPLRYGEFPIVFGPGGVLEPDVLIAQFALPDASGRASVGVAGSIALDVAKTTPLVIAEISSSQPFTFSDGIETVDIDIALEVEAPPPMMPANKASKAELTVARNVAALVPDGATLQFGIGGTIEAILGMLGDHTDLGIHSGMISDGIVGLAEKGAITNRNKGAFVGKSIVGLILGTETLLEWVQRNEEVLVSSARVTHGMRTLAQVQRLTCLNSAIEIDLSGQVNAEFLRGREYSGVGGQADFAFASSTNGLEGSKSIVALTATNRDGSVSKVVPELERGTTLTTPRYCVDHVVTEWGAAELRGKTLERRAKALAAIAHPDHREELERYVFDNFGR